MNFPESEHDAFHRTLDYLLQLIDCHVTDLVARAQRDDAVMYQWQTDPNLSELQSRQREEFQSYMAAWRDFDLMLCGDPPKVGAESFWPLRSHYPFHESLQIREAFIKCKEAIGYTQHGDTPRRALKVFREFLVEFGNMISARLYQDWPRPSIEAIGRDIRWCCYRLRSRDLNEVLEYVGTEQKWWRGSSESKEQRNASSHPKTNNDAAPQDVWHNVFGMPLGDATCHANEAAFYALYPAELADQLAKDLMRFERASSLETEKEWLYWTDSPLTQQPTYYRLLASLLPECPVNFSTFGSLWDASKNKENAGARDTLEAARAELRLFGLWLESSGLWNKRPDSEHGQPNVSSAVQCKTDFVTPEEVALKLQTRNITISPKTLKNTYKAAWGPPDGKEGNAELFDWNRIQPIVEGQFEVEFAD